MRLKRLTVTGYKNLIDCDIVPGKIHAITGCNGSGKSNLIEVLAFVAGLQSASEEIRSFIFGNGWAFIKGIDMSSGMWAPVSSLQSDIHDFELRIDCEIEVDGSRHDVSYKLKFEAPTEAFGTTMYRKGAATIAAESVTSKVAGTPGRASFLLKRKKQSVIVHSGRNLRSVTEFTCRYDTSALQALEFRDSKEYVVAFPVLAALRKAILSNILVRLDAEAFKNALYVGDVGAKVGFTLTSVINTYDPYQILLHLQKTPDEWGEFQQWLKRMVGVDGLIMNESKQENSAEKATRLVMPVQHGRLLSIGELSMGSSIAIGLLTVLFASRQGGGMAILEEPENYLHPGATIELVRLFREFSQERTVMFSTHSPVALNCLQPSEVTLMKPVGNGFVTTQAVSDLPEVIATLKRSFLSFGDLLQTNFDAEG